MFKEFQLDVATDTAAANDVDFQNMFLFDLPPEAMDLKDFVDGFKSKAKTTSDGESAELKEAKAYNVKAAGKLEQAKDLVPKSDQKISAKMMLE